MLFLGFYRNQWNIVPPAKFRNFQLSDQSLIMGRLVETRKGGVFSYGGLLGNGDIDQYKTAENDIDYDGLSTHQYDMYLNSEKFNTFRPYGSQSGVQGMIFGVLDQSSPLTPIENLRIYRLITSLFFAITLGFFLLWFLNEFGWSSALFAFACVISSPWLTLFGRNLFYVPAFFYIPIIVVTYYLDRYSVRLEQVKLQFGLFVFAVVFLKCLFNGFDFILPAILMLGAPYVYFAVRDKWGIHKFIQIGMVITIGAAVAIIVSLFILSLQLWVVFSDYSKAIMYIADTFSRRTMGDPQRYPEYAASLQANVWEVLRTYFRGKSAVAQTNLRFIDMIFIFAAFTGIYFIVERVWGKITENSYKVRALIIAAWLSILSPLLWYIIFKGQAYVHTHTNFLSWYMPFMIYGFALCGTIIENLYLSFKQTKMKS